MTAPHAKILVVDDELGIRAFMDEALGAAGYTVITAPSAMEAIRLTQTDDVALILIDQNMPGMTGLEAVRRLQENPRTQKIPAILMTGGTGVRADEAQRAGCFAHLSKPVSLELLYRFVALALEQRQA